MPLLVKILRILFTLILIGGMVQAVAAATPGVSEQPSETPTSIGPRRMQADQHPSPAENQISLASLARPGVPPQILNERVTSEEPTSTLSQQYLLEIIVMSGVLVLIGTLFMPRMLPQLSGYQKKIMHFFDHTITTYKTLIQIPCQHLASAPGPLKMQAAPAFQRPVSPPIAIRRRKINSPRAGDRVLVAMPTRKRQPSSPAEVIETFFQQSGFEVHAASKSEFALTSQLARYKQYGTIPVYIMNNVVVDHRHIQTICAGQKKPGKFRKLAFVVVDTPLEESAYQEIYRCKITDDFTIIPLSYLLVAKSVRHTSCAQQLEEKMGVLTGTSNLYAMTTPVADPLNFFGRTKIMNRLLNAIGQHHQLAVFGTPKIGKTWLFWQLKERLSAHITVYIDLRQLPKSSSYIYRKIIDECVRDIGFKYPELDVPPLQLNWTGTTDDDARKFTHDLVTLWHTVQQKQSQTQIILLLDGAEHVLPGSDERSPSSHALSPFMTTLPEIITQHKCLTAIMAFVSPQAFRVTFPKNWRCERKIALSSLTEEQCNVMITALGSQMGLRYPEETLSRLYYETGGHPYVTRQICSLIAKNLRRSKMIPLMPTMEVYTEVRVRDVEQAVTEYLEYKSEYLEAFWQQLLPAEHEVLRMMAHRNSCTRDELMQHIQTKGAQAQQHQALQCLIATNLIEKCEGKYAIKMGVFERMMLTQQQEEEG